MNRLPIPILSPSIPYPNRSDASCDSSEPVTTTFPIFPSALPVLIPEEAEAQRRHRHELERESDRWSFDDLRVRESVDALRAKEKRMLEEVKALNEETKAMKKRTEEMKEVEERMRAMLPHHKAVLERKFEQGEKAIRDIDVKMSAGEPCTTATLLPPVTPLYWPHSHHLCVVSSLPSHPRPDSLSFPLFSPSPSPSPPLSLSESMEAEVATYKARVHHRKWELYHRESLTPPTPPRHTSNATHSPSSTPPPSPYFLLRAV